MPPAPSAERLQALSETVVDRFRQPRRVAIEAHGAVLGAQPGALRLALTGEREEIGVGGAGLPDRQDASQRSALRTAPAPLPRKPVATASTASRKTTST